MVRVSVEREFEKQKVDVQEKEWPLQSRDSGSV
jgi:hypothetical protein